MRSLRMRALVAFVYAGLGWLLWVFLTVGALLLLPIKAEDDPRFLTAMYIGFVALVAVGAAMGWHRGGRHR